MITWYKAAEAETLVSMYGLLLQANGKIFLILIVDISVELFPVILLLLPVLIGPAVSVDSRFSPVYYCCSKFR